ncbi:MAG: SPFH domain-containing protein [Patescibacteria group bacterium]
MAEKNAAIKAAPHGDPAIEPQHAKKWWRFSASTDQRRVLIASAATVFGPLLVGAITGSSLLGLLAGIVSIGVFGIRSVPPVSNALLYLFWNRRTRIGFSEGPVWIPWFLGARLQHVDIKQMTHDISKEDNFTKDGMHLIYDIVVHYGITHIREEGLWKNFSRAVRWISSREQNAAGLYSFVSVVDMPAAIVMMDSMASDLTRAALNRRGFEQVFNFSLEGRAVAATANGDEIQNEVQGQLNAKLERIGITVYEFSLKDIDFHPSSAQAMEQKVLSKILSEAIEIAYQTITRIAKSLVTEGAAVNQTALLVQVIEAMKKSAESAGMLGPLLQSLTWDKVQSMGSGSLGSAV